jgi:hypothetical protein
VLPGPLVLAAVSLEVDVVAVSLEVEEEEDSELEDEEAPALVEVIRPIGPVSVVLIAASEVADAYL